MYEIFPAQDKYICWVGAVHGGTGPTRRRASRKLAMASSQGASSQQKLHSAGFPSKTNDPDDPDDPPPQEYLGFVLPDLSEDRWKYTGTEKYNPKSTNPSSFSSSSTNADVWEWDLTEGEMEMKYTFFTDASTGHPLELNMVGINLYTGGHKDHYNAYYYNYEEVSDGFSKDTFDAPIDVECTDAEPDAAAAAMKKYSTPATTADTVSDQPPRYSTMFLTLMRQVFPSSHYGVNLQYDSFMHRHGRRHLNKNEYHSRHRHYQTSKIFVETWNNNNNDVLKGRQRHRVALNRFADWSREEYRSLLGLKQKKELQNEILIANLTSTPHFLPAQVIWKGTPADSPVKDQAACGSCWAFSSSAALEAAVYRTTGTQTLVSEQEMMDCGWEPPGSNTGCMGGDQHSAILWALQRGGVAALADYPYRGVNDFCRSSGGGGNFNKVPIKGKLVVVKGGEQSLQAALISQGPMAVSVDAESDDFRFYAGGVYYNPDCATAAADLNHAVVVSGYGIADEESGPTPFWLVKNIWSKYWGEDGYIRIAREPNDCGIATEPMYVSTSEV
jgi:hypothetical protein